MPERLVAAVRVKDGALVFLEGRELALQERLRLFLLWRLIVSCRLRS